MSLFELFDFMPEGATDWAEKVDWINNWISVVSALCTVAITGVMIYFGIKYKDKGDGKATSTVSHNSTIETVWTVIPTVVVLYIFAYGFIVYKDMRDVPTNAMEVEVTAQKWSWEFKYSNGKKSNDLVVPIGKPVRLIMTSRDVLHSLFIPAMRVKEDIRAGSYSYLWFNANKTGDFHIFCAEYCGTMHSGMRARLKVVSSEQYQDFLLDRTQGPVIELPPAELGKQLFTQKGCTACHSIGAERLVGPGMKGLFQSGSRQCTDGTTMTVDENYVRTSILNSNAKIVVGYAPAMPVFEGQLTEDELSALIAYLKTL
jgi:cytochrome c oxidase subunit 2